MTDATKRSLRVGKLAVESMAQIINIFSREDLNDAEMITLIDRVATRYVGELIDPSVLVCRKLVTSIEEFGIPKGST